MPCWCQYMCPFESLLLYIRVLIDASPQIYHFLSHLGILSIASSIKESEHTYSHSSTVCAVIRVLTSVCSDSDSMLCAKSSKLKPPKSTSFRSSGGFCELGQPLETPSVLLSSCNVLPSNFSNTSSESGKSLGGGTSCFNVDPFDKLCE